VFAYDVSAGTLSVTYPASTEPDPEPSCEHERHDQDGICVDCGETVDHVYVDGVCSCGKLFPVAEDKIDGVFISVMNQTGFIVEWNTAYNVKSYWVFVDGVAYDHCDDSYMYIGGRTPGTTYEVAVIAELEDGTMLSLENADVVTAQTTVYDYSYSFEADAYSVTMNWDGYDDTKVFIYYGTSADELVVYDHSTTGTYTMSGLTANTTYFYQLAFFVDGKLVQTSDVFEVTTANDDSLNVTAVTEGDNVVLSWNANDNTIFWIVVNGEVYDGTSESSYTLSAADAEGATILIKAFDGKKICDYNGIEL
jgi:hypothetical protein